MKWVQPGKKGTGTAGNQRVQQGLAEKEALTLLTDTPHQDSTTSTPSSHSANTNELTGRPGLTVDFRCSLNVDITMLHRALLCLLPFKAVAVLSHIGTPATSAHNSPCATRLTDTASSPLIPTAAGGLRCLQTGAHRSSS